MKIIVNSDRSVQKEYEGSEINDGSQNENRVTTITFEVPEDYSSFAKRIVFITKDGNYFDEIVSDEYVLKNNVTKYKKLLAFVWLTNSTTHQDFRSEVFPLEFNYNENFSDSVPSEQEMSEIELLFDQLEALIAQVESIENLTYEIVEELPTEDIDPHVIYMILKDESEPNNVYNEWMYINNQWELIGTTAINLQPLQKEIDEINEMLFTHTTAESVNQEVNLNGNPNLEMNVTELDGRTEQDSTQGYQLFNIDGTTGGSSIDKYNNGFKLTKANNRVLRIALPQTYPAGTYTLSMKQVSHISSITNYFYVNIQKHTGSSYDSVKDAVIINNNTDIEIEIPSNFDTFYFYISSGETSTAEVTVDDVMLESGTTAHDWEKYTGGQASPNPSYKEDVKSVTGTQNVVVSGKNIFDTSNLSDTTGQGLGVSFDNSAITINNTSTGSGNVLASTSTGITLKAGTYTWKGILLSGTATFPSSGSNIAISIRNSSSSVASITVKEVVNNGVSSGTFTLTEDTLMYFLVFVNASGIVSSAKIGIMLIKGEDTSTTYEPYITPVTKQVHLGDVELAKIGDYKDKIYPSGGKWYLHKEVGKVTLNGTENWTVSQSGTSNWYYAYQVSIGGNTGVGTIAQLKSNYYKYASITSSSTDEGIWYSTNYIRIRYGTEDTPTNFKTWLSTHNVILYYALAASTDTEITGTLKEELDAIQKLQQLNGTTIVSIEGNLSADFKLVYENDSISDLNTKVASLESGKENKSNKKTSISSTSTDDDYPSGKAVYTYVNGIVGNINSLLDALNGTSV